MSPCIPPIHHYPTTQLLLRGGSRQYDGALTLLRSKYDSPSPWTMNSVRKSRTARLGRLGPHLSLPRPLCRKPPHPPFHFSTPDRTGGLFLLLLRPPICLSPGPLGTTYLQNLFPDSKVPLRHTTDGSRNGGRSVPSLGTSSPPAVWTEGHPVAPFPSSLFLPLTPGPSGSPCGPLRDGA